jgi:parvulin-like peptidyl-prolyl isomerase
MHGANFAKLSKRHNTDEDLRDKGGERGMLPVTTDDITKMSIGMEVGKVSEPIEIGNGGYTIIKVLKREPPRPKTYEEAGAEVSNLYQEQRSKDLEREWLDRLKQKYPVKQYKDQLSKAFANPRAEKAL